MPWLDVRGNVGFGLRGRLPKAVVDGRCAEALALVGLGAFARAMPGQLSGGMAQRVAIARALVMEPELLLLTSPSPPSTPSRGGPCRTNSSRSGSVARPTIVFVTHDVEEAVLLGERVLEMQVGRVVGTKSFTCLTLATDGPRSQSPSPAHPSPADGRCFLHPGRIGLTLAGAPHETLRRHRPRRRPADRPPAAADKPKTVRITYVTAPFNLTSIVMREKGFLDEAFAPFGIKVDSPEITSGAQQTQAIAAVRSTSPACSAAPRRSSPRQRRAPQGGRRYARSPKAYFLMTRADGPARLADLKGKKIAGPKGTVLNQLLVAALASQKLTLADVEYINMDLPAARAALLAGQVDVATLAGANVTWSKRPADARSPAARADQADDRDRRPHGLPGAASDLVAAYFAAHRKALDFMARNPDEALAIASKEQKISLEDARASCLSTISPRHDRCRRRNLIADRTS